MVGGKNVKRSKILIGGSLLCLALGAPALHADSSKPSEVALADQEEGAELATRLRSELSAIAGTPSAEDLEASLIFVIGQKRYSDKTIEYALSLLSTNEAGNATLQQAVRNVRFALARGLRPGTAAIDGDMGFNFSMPFTGLAGGGSGGAANYGS